ncbi:HNH endonuclease [Corallococcus sp. AB032C]|uniref:HNH endonuclease signature motif containing protein n=1 Tax=Corallococcus TaxID=83461 RepID=UPI000EC5EB67|nr:MULTISPECIES: HNH endonuclease [Corallococcus]NPC50973.1 HNH endonuclease [Corallococcus exiguus]RKH77607.1 HNH endonuclease [Corallococcus sp. AB032C]
MGTPIKRRILEHWKSWLIARGVDLGEPCCWACRKYWGDKFDVQRTDAPWDEVVACWEKTPLQRCHIVPRSLGGSDEPSNLFLMCAECHDLAPNLHAGDLFMKWVENQNHGKRLESQLKAAMDSFGMTGQELHGFGGTFVSDEFQQWFAENSGLHGTQTGTQGVVLTMSTILGALIEYRRGQRVSGK